MRQQFLDSIDHRDDIRSGLPLNVQDDCGSLVHPGGLPGVLGVVEDGGDIGQLDGGAVLVGDDERSVIRAGEQLVVGSNLVRLMSAVEVSLGLIDVGGDDGRAQVLQIEAVGGHRRGVRLNPDSRFLSAADADQADPWQLRNFGRQPRVGQVLDLRQRKIRRSQGESQDGGVGWIGLTVDGRSRQVRRKVCARGIDGLLHFLFGDIDTQAEVELQRDDRAAVGARGSHLLESGHLSELTFERRGHRGRHHVRAGAGIEGNDLNDGIIHLRQRRNGQLRIPHRACQQDTHHQHGGGHRPENEDPGRVHLLVGNLRWRRWGHNILFGG